MPPIYTYPPVYEQRQTYYQQPQTYYQPSRWDFYQPIRWEWITPTTSSTNIFMTNNDFYVWPQASPNTVTIHTQWQTVTHEFTNARIRPLSAEDMRQENERAEHRGRVEAERRAAERVVFAGRQVATTRARNLLEMVLTPEQRESLHISGHIPVIGSRGRRYCINANGQSGNVDLLDDNGVVAGRFCAHPGGPYLPDPDAWLAQMLALQTDEEAFLRIANLHWGVRPVLQSA